MVNNLVNSVVGSIYIGADKRTILSQENITSYQPLSNNNVLFVYLENAFGNSGVVTASFKSGTQRIPTTQPFFLRFIKDVSKVVGGEVTPRHFSKYILTIPQPVANLNLNKTEPLNIHTTINVSSSIKFIGTFNTLVDLTAHVGSVEKDIAYVIESGIYGYYEYVLDNGNLQWLRIENDDITRKVVFSQYGFFDIGIQGGYFSEVPHTNINDWQEYVIWQEINATNYNVVTNKNDIEDLQIDLGATKDRVEENENDINELDGRVGVNESDVDDLETEIGNIKNGTTIVKKSEQDASGNVITSTYETKNDATSKLATKVDKTTKVIGLELQDGILLTEFKTALGNATQSVAGLLSAEDKTHLDGLVALLESSDGNNVVDTIGEILEIFNNYPEGADLVTVLNGKVDKEAGKGLSQNDFTDALKNKLDGLLNGSQYYDKIYIDALKDQNGWKSQLLTLTPLSPSGTIATATLLLYNTLKLQVKNTTTSFVDTDSVEVSLGVVTGNKIQLSDTSVYLEIGATNSTFVAPTGWELQIVGLKYTELKAVDTTYDNTVSEMTATTVQGAIDEVVVKKANRYIDAPIAELSNHSLREVFEVGIDVPLTKTYWVGNGGTVTNTPNGILYTSSSEGSERGIYSAPISDLFSGRVYYIGISGNNFKYPNSTGFDGNFSVSPVVNNRVSAVRTMTTSNEVVFFQSMTTGEQIEYTDFKLIDMTTMGISSLTKEQMDYWFNVYQQYRDGNDSKNIVDSLQTLKENTQTAINEQGQIIYNKTVYPKDTTFMVVSTNIANVDGRLVQSSIDPITGEPVFNANNELTDYIPIKPNTQYTIKGAVRKGYYGINKEYISTDTINGTFITPSNAYFMRIVTSFFNMKNTLQLNEGNVLLTYEKYYSYLKDENLKLKDDVVTQDKVDFIIESSNIFNKERTTLGKMVNIDGEVVDNTGYYVSDYIPIEIGKVYFFNGIMSVALYNHDKEFLRRFDAIPNPVLTNNSAYYMRCNLQIPDFSSAYINYETDKGYDEHYIMVENLKLKNIINDVLMPIELPNELAQLPESTYSGFPTPESLKLAYQDLETNYPDYVTVEIKGKDASNTHDIYVVTLKPKELNPNYLSKPVPKILLTTGVHGGEKTSIFSTYHFVKSLCDSWDSNEVLEHLRFNYEIKIIPLASPYAFANPGEYGGRTNYNDVDINRNQPYSWKMSSGITYGGPSPLSEPESIIINDFINENLDSILMIDFHTNGSGGNDWGKSIYIDLGGQELKNEIIYETSNYWIKKMSRFLVKNYTLTPDTDYLGFMYRELSQGKVAEEATHLGLNATTIECWEKFPSESTFYSSDTIKGSAEILINFIMMTIKRLVHQFKG